jgi:hypothetical protein
MKTDTLKTLPRHFGVNFPPVCCRKDMRLTRRAPHPLYGLEYELQSFECRICGRDIDRSADGAGSPHVSDTGTKEQSKSELTAT